jgi:tetratricopeptide (TPR) repeat protein
MKKYFVYCLLICLLALSSCMGEDKSPSQNKGSDTTRMQLEALNQKITEDAENPDLYDLRAKYFISDRQFDKAMKDVNKAISINDKKPSFYITLSDIYLFLGQTENCREALKKAIGMDPSEKNALLKLAKLYLIVKDYKNCYLTIKQIFEIDNGNATAYYIRAIGLLEQGDTIRAVDDLKQAVDKNQEFFEAYVQLGELYSLRKDPMAALYLKNALNLNPKSKEVLYLLGLYYQESGQYEKAIETYQNLAKVDTASRESLYNIGYIHLVYLKNFPLAIENFTASLAKDPGYYQAYFNRGYAYELSGNYKNALADYQKSLKIKVNYDKAIEGLNRLDKVMIRK